MGKKIIGVVKSVISAIGVIVAIVFMTVVIIRLLPISGDGRTTTTVVDATAQEVAGFIDAAKTYPDKSLIPELPEKTILKVSTVERVLSPASDLITLKNSYSGGGKKTDYKTVWDHKVPLTTDQVVYTYEGCVCVGFDIKDVVIDVDNDAKTITLTIPEARIISNELYEDEFQFWDVKNSVLNGSSLDEYSEIATEIKAKEEKELFEEEGFEEKVKDNAENVFTMLLSVCTETSGYELVFR